jgi:peptide deformylase
MEQLMNSRFIHCVWVVLLVSGCATNKIRKLDIVTYPNPILSRVCENVSVDDDEAVHILNEMAQKVCGDEKCVGLAAPQVGVPKNIVFIDTKEAHSKPYRMINPKIIYHSRNMVTSPEGCMSLPGVGAKVQRYSSVIVEYLDDSFKRHWLRAEGFLAFCCQHEIDHLRGKMYIDHLPKVERAAILERYTKLKSGEKKLLPNDE